MTNETQHQPADQQITFAGDFKAPTREEWEVAVAKVLNRTRPEDKQLSPDKAIARLRTTTVDGTKIEPIYTRDDAHREPGVPGCPPFTRGTTVRQGDMDAWDIRGYYDDPDPVQTKKDIDVDLERGVMSLWLRVGEDAIRPSDLATVLSGVYLNMAKVDVSSRTNQRAAADALLDLCERASAAKDTVTLGLGLDPIGFAALHGTAPVLDPLPGYATHLLDYRRSRAITVDGTIWHNAGAGDIHEIAWSLATATEYARFLMEHGISADDAFDTINFRVTATCDEFATIARLRALRTCWHRIGEVLGVSPEHRGARQHAVSSWREITRDDPHVNILRGSISAFSASVGGAEATTVLPFDTAWGLPMEFSRRIARNTQILLAEESNVGRVNDPGGGSWYIENLSTSLADSAWVEFQRIEGLGGMAHVVATKQYEEPLAELNRERAARLSTRKQPITGVSEFPKIDETDLEVRPRPEAPQYQGVAWRRDAEVFEQLRDRTVAAQAAGLTPQVFLACLGSRRDFGPREGFASNVFHIAGLPTPQSEGGSVDEIVTAWKAAQTPVVCLCSSGRVYAEQGLDVARALAAAGAKQIILAGSLAEFGENADAAREVIGTTIALGVNVVDTLTTTLDTLGVAR